MSHNVNRSGLKLKERGPVWKIKVGVYAQLSQKSFEEFIKSKVWEIKVILN